MTNNSTTEKTKNNKNTKNNSRHKAAKAAIVLAALVGTGSAALPATAFAAQPTMVAADDNQPMTADEYAAAMTLIRERTAELNAQQGPVLRSAGWTKLASTLAVKVADNVFGDVVGMGFNTLIDVIGLGDGTAEALTGIQNSINTMMGEVEQNQDLLKGLMEQQSWTRFYNADLEAQTRVEDLNDQTDLIIALEGIGEAPSQSELKAVFGTSETVVAELRADLVGAGGGSIWQLQDALAGKNADVAWPHISAYRGQYRSVLAQAMINLEWATQYEDLTPDHLALRRDIAETKARSILDDMYNTVGVAYPEPTAFSTDAAPRPVGSSISLNQTRPGTIYAAPSRPLAPGEEIVPIRTQGPIMDMYTQLRDEFDAEPKNGRTFQTYLNEHNFPTGSIWSDSFEEHIYETAGVYTGYVSYDVTRTPGDKILEDHMGEGQDEVYSGTTLSVVKEQVAQRHAELYDAAYNHPSYQITAATNANGYAISSDENAGAMAVNGLRTQLGAATAKANDLGPLTIENLGGYDTAIFVDGGSGHLLGSADISTGALSDVRFDAPDSDWVEVIVGTAVDGQSDTIVQAGSTVLDTSNVTPDNQGKVEFSTITTVNTLS